MTPGVDFTGITVTFFCHDGSGNVLFARRSEKCRDEHHRWEVGGGRLEYGEDPREAVLREVREEYGVEGVIEHTLPAISLRREHNGSQTHWIALPFVIRIPRAEVRIGEPEYISEVAWHTLDALPDPLHTGLAAIVERMGDTIRACITGPRDA